jgi:hypothetical protein
MVRRRIGSSEMPFNLSSCARNLDCAMDRKSWKVVMSVTAVLEKLSHHTAVFAAKLRLQPRRAWGHWRMCPSVVQCPAGVGVAGGADGTGARAATSVACRLRCRRTLRSSSLALLEMNRPKAWRGKESVGDRCLRHSGPTARPAAASGFALALAATPEPAGRLAERGRTSCHPCRVFELRSRERHLGVPAESSRRGPVSDRACTDSS